MSDLLANLFLFCQVLLFTASVPILLRLKPATLANLLERGTRGVASDSHPDLSEIQRILSSIESVIHKAGPLVRSKCLTRGLTRYYFLRRIGMDVSLCFGMGRVESGFIGHCWLVKDGELFMEDFDPRLTFGEMFRLPESAGRDSVPQPQELSAHLPKP